MHCFHLKDFHRFRVLLHRDFSPMHSNLIKTTALPIRLTFPIFEPREGVEPTTSTLQGWRSTNWANEAIFILFNMLFLLFGSLPRGIRTLDPQINNTTLAFTQANYLSCCSLDYSITMHFCLGVPYVVSTPFISVFTEFREPSPNDMSPYQRLLFVSGILH